MIIIIYLNKPKLHFEHLDDFNNNGNGEKFDTEKHEKCSFDDYEIDQNDEDGNENDDDDDNKDKKDAYIDYIIFPGLSIENNIENKSKKRNLKKVVIYKTQVIV